MKARPLRLTWLVLLSLVLALLLVADWQASPGGRIGPSVSRALTRPNLLLILTDDQNTEAMRAMSYLQARPYGSWISFPNAFINTPLCCPSRATLLSGQYSSHHQVRDNSRGASFNDRSTVATWLNAAGYRTGLIGKYLNGYPYASQPANYVPPGWNTWAAFSGGERYSYYTLNVNGTPVSYGGQRRTTPPTSSPTGRSASSGIPRRGRSSSTLPTTRPIHGLSLPRGMPPRSAAP